MATIRSTVRACNSALGRIERANRRKEREAAKRFKALRKMEAIEEASSAVKEWQEYVQMIKSMHRDCTDPIDWHEVLFLPEPVMPQYSNHNEQQAEYALINFEPSFIDKFFLDIFFSNTEKKRTQLERKITESKEIDEEIYAEKMKEYEDEKKQFDELKNIARGVLNKDLDAYGNVILFFDPFTSIKFLGEKINISFTEKSADASIYVHDKDIIPDYTLSQTSTGKLSRKQMAKGAYNELYQDHVCSVSLRVAREIFNYLPVEYVMVNAISEMLNTQTGFLEEQPILSVLIPKQTLDQINLDNIDPSDSMANFKHSMNFKKTEGFRPVKKVNFPS